MKKSDKTILAIETCTNICSVAILYKGECLEIVEQQDRMHSKLLIPMVEQLLTKLDLRMPNIDFIACSRGPGSFTGVRIGVGVAKGLAYGQDIPIIGVSSLAVLAAEALKTQQKGIINSLLDARMGELYSASYYLENNHLTAIGSEKIQTVDELDYTQGVFIGTGAKEYESVLLDNQATVLPIIYPYASGVLKLIDTEFAELTCAKKIRPVYLRNKVVN